MYRFRLRFFIDSPGIIQDETTKVEFTWAENLSTTFESLQKCAIKDTTEFVLTAKGFKTKSAALKAGHILKDALLILGVKWHIGVDAGKDRANAFFANFLKDKILQEHQVRVIDNVHGVTAFLDDLPFTAFSAKGQLVRTRNAQDFVADLTSILDLEPLIPDKERLALELYGASFYEHSLRAKFLTLVLAVESLLELQERSQSALAVVQQLDEVVKSSEIDNSEKKSILGSLQWLRKESIGQGLRKLANTYLHDKVYDGQSAHKWICQFFCVKG